jgi:3-oxoacyl-[acyl-carrier protein] reductase
MTPGRRFAGQTVLVSGASRGLGSALARAFAQEGAFVGIGYHRHEKEARELLDAVRAQGGDGVELAFDVRDAASIDAALAKLAAVRPTLDVLVNNAAVSRDELFPMMEKDSWEEVISVNLGGPFRLCRAVVRPMLARRRGVIVNVGSIAGIHASPGQANYSAAKGGLVALTRTLAAELGPRGVRVNAVIPGILSTGMATRIDHRRLEKLRGMIPLQRFGTAEEVARAVLFVASEEASYLIGQSIVVDGGLTL